MSTEGLKELSFSDIYECVVNEADSLRVKKAEFKTRPLEERKLKNKIIRVEDILDEDNEVFVTNLYYKILGREPDKSGFDNQIKKLEENLCTKEDLIYAYWQSEEGRKKNIEVVGFSKNYNEDRGFRSKLKRIPLLGRLFSGDEKK